MEKNRGFEEKQETRRMGMGHGLFLRRWLRNRWQPSRIFNHENWKRRPLIINISDKFRYDIQRMRVVNMIAWGGINCMLGSLKSIWVSTERGARERATREELFRQLKRRRQYYFHCRRLWAIFSLSPRIASKKTAIFLKENSQLFESDLKVRK